MGEYIGSVGSKISVEVTYKKHTSYQTHYTYYGETHNIFILEDASGNCIVWNTTGWLEDKKFNEKNGMYMTIFPGSKLLLTATVKEHSEYKGTKQTVISRPRFKLLEMAKSPEEIRREREAEQERKRQEQYDSIKGNDEIWEMPYKQFKEHYSDCETIIDSYDEHLDSRGNPTGHPTIKVIIREGRLKNSGVRGQHYKGFEFTTGTGSKVCYRAISEETARKRMKKEFPDRNTAVWECTKIYNYQDVHRIW